MSANLAAIWYHTNQSSAQSECEHCGGIVRHERRCITCDSIVHHAYGVAIDPEKLSLRDRLILPHGVS
jgi:primosomal protein N'